MKKLLLALGLAVLGVACRASGANMHDSSACTSKDCADCAAMKADDCKNCTPEEMAECQKKCEGEQVCPVTGKSMNN
jgi:hypothetical protein